MSEKVTPETIFGSSLVAAIDAEPEGVVRITHPSGASVEVARHAHVMRVLEERDGVQVTYDASTRTVTFVGRGHPLSVTLPAP